MAHYTSIYPLSSRANEAFALLFWDSENLEIFCIHLCSLSVNKGRIKVITLCKYQGRRVPRRGVKNCGDNH